MIILDQSHHDLEVVYQHRYRTWRTAKPDADFMRLSGQLSLALQNLKDAGYTPEMIARLERGALYTRQPISAYLDNEGE